VVTTTAKTGPAITRALLDEMSQGEPDVIVFELGDGILGAYGVEAIPASRDIKDALSCVVLSAKIRSPPGRREAAAREVRHRAGGGHGSRDRQRGRVNIIREQFGVAAHNAITDGAALGDSVIDSAGLKTKPADGSRGMSAAKDPGIVLGGTGYVAGELLRLIAAHPRCELEGGAVGQPAGEPVAKSFRASGADLSATLKFAASTSAANSSTLAAVGDLSAAPHGVAAKLIDDCCRRPKRRARSRA
jgi:hypothetical protein